MENISEIQPIKLRELSYYRQRFKNRVFGKIVSFFVDEAKRTGITKSDIAKRLNKDPAQITRILSNPGNLTLDTISDILLSMDSEAQPPEIIRFSDRQKSNYAHPLIAQATGVTVIQRLIDPSVALTINISNKSAARVLSQTGSASVADQ